MGIFSGLVKFLRAGFGSILDEGMGMTVQIEEAKEHGNVEFVRNLIAEHPEAATNSQKKWLAEELAKKEAVK